MGLASNRDAQRLFLDALPSYTGWWAGNRPLPEKDRDRFSGRSRPYRRSDRGGGQRLPKPSTAVNRGFNVDRAREARPNSKPFGSIQVHRVVVLSFAYGMGWRASSPWDLYIRMTLSHAAVDLPSGRRGWIIWARIIGDGGAPKGGSSAPDTPRDVGYLHGAASSASLVFLEGDLPPESSQFSTLSGTIYPMR